MWKRAWEEINDEKKKEINEIMTLIS